MGLFNKKKDIDNFLPEENQGSSYIMSFKPKKYDDIEDLANTLILRKAIKLDLNETDISERKRILDFLCGVAFTLKLEIIKVDNNIYQFTN